MMRRQLLKHGCKMINAQSLRLIEIIQKLSQCRTLESIIEIVKSAARELAAADGATFVLKEEDLCHYVDEDAISPMFKGKHFPSKICVSDAAMQDRCAIVIPDIYNDSRIPIDVYRPTFVKSMCMTPIRSIDPIGAIGVYWKESHIANEDEQQLLRALADSTSTAIENVNLQTQLQARLEEVKHLSRLKDEFLRNLSHELRTPLNVILGWTQILDDGATPEEFREGISIIQQSSKRQEVVIKDLLDCSKIISGNLELNPSTFDIGQLLEPALKTLELAIQAKKLDIRIESSSAGALVNADWDRSREVVWQLLSNAVKFSGMHGAINVRCYHNDKHAGIEVEDQGIGIAEDFLPQVFDLFTREDAGMTRSYSGTGLGLPMGRYYAEAQGGTLSVVSEGKSMGATAKFELPVAAIRFVPKRNADPVYMAKVFNHLLGQEAVRAAE